MDTNLKDKIDIERKEIVEGKVEDGPNDAKDKKRSMMTSSTWGTLLMMLIWAAVSVSSYAPLKSYIFASFTRMPDYQQLEQFIILILSIGGLSTILLTIIAFAIPYASQSKASIIKLYNRTYVEFKFLIWIIFFMLFYWIRVLVVNDPLNFDPAINYEYIIRDANWYLYLIGIPVTFNFCTLIYLSICYIKHIYHKGFVNGFIKNSIFGRILFYIIDSIKKIANGILEFDTTDDSHKKLLRLLGINLIALGLISLTFPFGIILALVYTGVLFSYIAKMVDKARVLNEASSRLAKGNFDAVLPEDMGILSPYARNLNNIKEGFKIAVEKEVRSQNMKAELISNVSHDLKTPLTSIITYVDLLKNEETNEDIRKEYIDVLDKKSKRLKVLIDDLFEASKASSGNIEMHPEKLDLVALLRQTLGELEEKISESSLQMKVSLPENKVICELDGRRTYRIFDNVISNILKYAMPNTRVYINTEEGEKDISFIFKNISSYEMNFDASEITERFTRGDKSRNTEGSGLGLAITKSLVELQGGSLDISIDGDLFKLTVAFPKA